MSKAELKYYYKNREKILKLRKEKRTANVYTVYYIPEEHYCGITKMKPEKRLAHHKYEGRNIEGWRVLFCSEDKAEAYHHEALFHSVLGMNGLIQHNKREE